jgi:pilus assembly protein Flp/PilA
MLHLLCTLQTAGLRVLAARRDQDRGQTAAEYLGIVVVVAIIIAAIATSGIGSTIASNIMTKISEIFSHS